MTSADELIRLCIAGDEKGWSVFVERFARLVRWAIRVKISQSLVSVNEYEIDEILQQIFVDIWKKNKLKNLNNPESISSWLVVIAQNATVDFIRSKIRLPATQAEDLMEEAIPASTDNPRTEAEDDQLYKTVEELIELLPLRERRIITLELFYDLRHREIANIMGMPINTVSTIVARIKQELKEKLLKRGYDV